MGDRDSDSHLHPMAESIFLPGKDRTFPAALRAGNSFPSQLSPYLMSLSSRFPAGPRRPGG